MLHLFIPIGQFFSLFDHFISVSSTRRTRSHRHVKQGQKLSLRHTRVLQLCSDLTADWGLHPPLEYSSFMCHIYDLLFVPFPFWWCSFFVKAQPTDSGTWSLSRCSPSSVAFHSTLSSFRRHPLTSSCSSDSTLIGPLKQGGAFHWMILITLIAMKCLLLWPKWTWAWELTKKENSMTNYLLTDFDSYVNSI